MPASAASPPAGHAGFSFWTAVCFTVNFIMGCGFLGVPRAFVSSGLVLGPAVVLVVGYLCNLSKDLVLEAMARAEGLAASAERGVPLAALPASAQLVSHTRKFEVTDLFGRLLGPRARAAYVLVLSGYMYGGLWAYGTVFASSFAANVPLPGLNGGATCNVEDGQPGCLSLFLAYLAIFGALAVPLACMELREQVAVQVTMAAARILVVALMTGTVLAGYACDGVVFSDLPPDNGRAGGGGGAPLAVPAGVGTVLPIATFAFIFHHSVPVLAQPVADKASLNAVFRMAFIVTGVAYASLGGVLAAWFGGAVESQANLNWQFYVGCVPRPGAGEPAVTPAARSPAAAAAAFVVLIFPALDVLSAFPLNAITLGNNLMSAACPGMPITDEEAADAADAAAEGARARGGGGAGEGAGGPASAGLLDDVADDEEGDGARGGSARGRKEALLGGRAGGGGGGARPAGAAGAHAALAASAPTPGVGGGAAWSLASLCGVVVVGGGGARPRRPWTRTSAVRVAFRLVAAVPPLAAGALSTAYHVNLGQILQFTGLIGVAIAFAVPAVLRAWAAAAARAAAGGGAGADADSDSETAGLAAAGDGGAKGKGGAPGGGGGAGGGGVFVRGLTWRAALLAPLAPGPEGPAPYAHWSTRFGSDRALLALSLPMAALVLSQIITG